MLVFFYPVNMSRDVPSLFVIYLSYPVLTFWTKMPIKSTEKAQRTLVLPGDQARDIMSAPGDDRSPVWRSNGREPRVCWYTGFSVPVFPLLHDLRSDTST